jgi:tetratricopeptide (TPR) repeat protein
MKRNLARILLVCLTFTGVSTWTPALASPAGAPGSPGAPAAAEDPGQSKCAPPNESAGTKDVVIDLRLRQTKGITCFTTRDQVRVVIINKNPFKFQYKVTVKETTVAEPALAEFLSLLGLPKTEAASTEEKTGTDKASALASAMKLRATAAFVIGGCSTQAQDRLERLTETHQELVTKLDAANKTLTELDNKNKEVESAIKDAAKVIDSDTALCAALVKEASDLLQKLSSYKPELEKFRDAIESLQASARVQKEAVKKFEKDFPSCTDAPLKEYLLFAELIQETASERLLKNYAKLKAAKENFDKMKSSIERVLADPNAFYEVRFVGPFDLPTDVAITVEAKGLAETDKFAEIVSAKLNFGGGPRFVLAGGLAFTQLEKQEFQRVQPATGDPIVGLKENSDTRIVPLVILHTRIWNPRCTGGGFPCAIHLSAGVTAKNDNKGTDIEYLFGPSISFAEERFFITVGAYGGKQQRLEGNFALGSPVPADLSELPVRKEYHWKFGFALTYKIK